MASGLYLVQVKTADGRVEMKRVVKSRRELIFGRGRGCLRVASFVFNAPTIGYIGEILAIAYIRTLCVIGSGL
jgi:hypothetical protein